MSPTELRADRKAKVAARPVRRRGDIVRPVVVMVSVGFAIACAAVASGVTGGSSIAELQGGALGADATLLAPARPAFSIWGAVYLGLVGYALWQALPAQRADARQRVVGWWIAGTAVLNGAWLLAAQYGPLWSTVVVIVALFAALAATFVRVVRSARTRSPWLDLALVDAVTGLHLGWVTVASAANVFAWLPEAWSAVSEPAAVWTLAGLALVGLAGSWASGWRIAPPWAMGWGAAWIGVQRLTGEPASDPVGWTALAAAAVLVVVPVAARLALALRGRD
ncbi:MAG: tryptophan-rich sensory protein [Microbacterium sp.]